MAKKRLENRAGRGAVIAQVAAELLLGEELPQDGPILLVDDDTEILAQAIAEAGGQVSRWDRRAYGGRAARVWPKEEPAAAAMVRLPKDWASFELSLNAVAGRLAPGARLWVYGGNAEGIRSAPRRMTARYFGEVETRLLKRRARVLECARGEATEGLASGIESFRAETTLSLPSVSGAPLEVTLASYPGAFAKGALDGGTAALLKGAAGIKPRRRVLDFCCGIGVVGVWARARWPEAELTLLDVDAVSLHAAAENLPGARVVLSDGFRQLSSGERFDAILSNPPIHRGAEEDMTLLHELASQAPRHLTAGGMLVMVCQKSVGCGALLEPHFKQVQLLTETTSFQVWCGVSPVRARG
ncbi:MAG: class I SAM-dependent methyltransferase [Polyangiaceae bacterium]|nr:class I SAM-dependent methyltransferase [Polyangiaceae bacterium]MCW5792627.1 class I SAM-dependent methyltransferase [Polyangiaceae bacterium]